MDLKLMKKLEKHEFDPDILHHIRTGSSTSHQTVVFILLNTGVEETKGRMGICAKYIFIANIGDVVFDDSWGSNSVNMIKNKETFKKNLMCCKKYYDMFTEYIEGKTNTTENRLLKTAMIAFGTVAWLKVCYLMCGNSVIFGRWLMDFSRRL